MLTPPSCLDAGFYVFLAAAVVAVIAATGVVVLILRARRYDGDAVTPVPVKPILQGPNPAPTAN